MVVAQLAERLLLILEIRGSNPVMAKPKSLLNQRCNLCKQIQVEKVRATVNEGKLSMKEMVKLITDLTDDISAANISHWKKDEMRTGEFQLQ